MKYLKSTLTLVLSLLFGVGLQAQVLVTGTNLNIGSNNEFGSFGNDTYGNAIGLQNYVGGANTLAVGYSDTVSFGCTNSFIAGANNRIDGINSFAIGGYVKAIGNMSIGIGYYLKSGNEKNIVIGMGVKGNNDIPSRFLQNDYQHTLMIGMNSTKPTLTVSPSPNDYPQGDTINKTGKIAIGDVPVPDIAAKLHIRSDYGEDAGIILEPKDMGNSNTFIRMRDEDHGIEVDNKGTMKIKSRSGNNYSRLLLEGKVGIKIYDTTYMNSSYSLFVNGGILTDKIKIKYYYHWPDYVFDSDYPLMPLSDLKDYINKNHHLPEVPTEKDVIDEGVEVGKMQDILLKKIEELTLYLLRQQETVEMLEQRIAELEGNKR